MDKNLWSTFKALQAVNPDGVSWPWIWQFHFWFEKK
jgi:hypothetical protein